MRTEEQKAARRARRGSKSGRSGTDENGATVSSDASSSMPPDEPSSVPPPSDAEFFDTPKKAAKTLSAAMQKAIAQEIADAESGGYTVAASLTGDPRWKLLDEEEQRLAKAWAFTMELFADDPEFMRWLGIGAIVLAHATPVVARLAMGPLTQEVLDYYKDLEAKKALGLKVAK